MAKQKKKTNAHDLQVVASSDDVKVIQMEYNLGIVSYAVFWKLVEKLTEASDFKLKYDLDFLSYMLRFEDKAMLKSIIEDCDLFVIVDGFFYLQTLRDKMLKKAAAAAKRKANLLAKQTALQPNETQDVASEITPLEREVNAAASENSRRAGQPALHAQSPFAIALNDEPIPSENKAAASEIDIVIELPLNDGTVYEVARKLVYDYEDLYPSVDVMQELRNMKGWLISNMQKRKTRAGILRFINTWLANKQNKGVYNSGSGLSKTSPTPQDGWAQETREARQVRDNFGSGGETLRAHTQVIDMDNPELNTFEMDPELL